MSNEGSSSGSNPMSNIDPSVYEYVKKQVMEEMFQDYMKKRSGM